MTRSTSRLRGAVGFLQAPVGFLQALLVMALLGSVLATMSVALPLATLESASASTGPNPNVDLSLSIADGGNPFVSGATGTYTLVVHNTGSASSTDTVSVMLSPSGYPITALASATGSGWACSISSRVCNTSAAVAGGGNLPPISVVVNLAATSCCGALATMNATVNNSSDGTPDNNSAAITTPVGRAVGVNLTLSIGDGGSPFVAGSSGSYTVTVRNPGTVASSGTVAVSFSVSGYPVTGLQSLSGTGWGCSVSSRVCTTSSSVTAGGSLAPITVTVGLSPATNCCSFEAALSATVDNSSDTTPDNNTVSMTTPVVGGSVDIALTMATNKIVFDAGGTGNYSMTVRNTGSGASTGVVSVQFPRPFVGWSASGSGWSCSTTAGVCTNAASIPAGGTLPVITASGPIPSAGSAPDYTNGVATLDNPSDTNTANNSVSMATPIVKGAVVDLASRVAGPSAPVVYGGGATYTVMVRNAGTAASSGTVGVTVSPSYPANGIVSASGTGWSCSIATALCTNSSSLAAGANLPAITVRVSIAPNSGCCSALAGLSATIDNPSDTNTANNSSSVTTPVVAGPVDLTVNIADGGSPFVAGGMGTYTLAVRNSGTGASSGVITVTFPQPFSGWSASGTGWSCSTTPAVCTTASSVAAAASLPAITVTGPVPLTNPPSQVSASANVDNPSDANVANNYAAIATSVVPGPVDLTVNVADGGSPFVAGGTGSYTIAVHNVGTAASSGTVTVTYGAPFAGWSASGTGWSCSTTPAVCTTASSVAAGAGLPPITVTGPVPSNASSNASSSATVDNPSDTNTANNSAYVTTSVVPGATDLTLNLADGGSPFTAGGTGSVTILVRNAGTAPTSGTVSVTVGAPYAGWSASGSGWSCTTSPNVCQASTVLGAGTSLPPITVAGTVPTNASSTAYSSATVDNPWDTNTNNNSASITTPVVTPNLPPVPASQTYGLGGGLHGIDPSGRQADPVNTATGAYSTAQTDGLLPGLGTTFSFTRTYTSSDATSGPLGPGWIHPYMTALIGQPTGDLLLRSADGQELLYALESDGSYSPPPGGRSTIVSQPPGWLVTTHDQTKMSFDAGGHLVKQTDRNGIGLTMGYDATGNLTSITDHAARVVTFAYDASGHLTSVALPLSRVVNYTYDGTGHLATATLTAGSSTFTTAYTYDASGLLATVTDANNHTVVTNTYDAGGRVVKQVDARGKIGTFAWDASTETSTFTDANGHQWADVYSNNVLLRRVDPLGGITSFAYDNQVNTVAITDPNGNTTMMSYDASGNTVSRTAPPPLSYMETYTYNAFNDPLTATDGRNNTTSYAYDARGNLTSKTDPDGALTTYTRDPVTAAVTAITDPRGKMTLQTYDAKGNLIKVTSPLGEKTTMTYDIAGRLLTRVDPRGNAPGGNPANYKTTLTYNPFDRVTKVVNQLGLATSTTYDKVGNKTKVTDANAHATSYAYDAANHLTKVTAPGGAATSYAYDAVGNMIKRTDPKTHVTAYAYDAANRLNKMTSPLGRVTTFGYDASGNRTTVNAPTGVVTSSNYDALNRLVGVAYSDGTPGVSFTYDADGNRTQLDDAAGIATYGYDARNRLTNVTRGADTFAYSYDAVGNITSRTYPDGTVAVATFDDDNRLAAIDGGNGPTTYAYDPASELLTTTLPAANGYIESRTYDRAGRMTDIKSSKGASTLVDYAYTYDNVGNPTTIASTSETATLTYDVRDRLTNVCYGASCAGGSIAWTYDAVGNRLTEARAAATTNYAYDNDDELTSAAGPSGTVTYTYDAAGRTLTAGSQTYTWDAASRMSSTSGPSGTTNYSYDGDGRRLSSTAGGATTNYGWDVNGSIAELALERDANNSLIRRYVYGAGPVSMTTPTGSFYYHHDALDSAVALTSAAGATEWTYTYEPFGTSRTANQVDVAAPVNMLRFDGEYLDSTGLYHLRARQYDPAIARFLTTDPLPQDKDASAVASYAYVNDRPTVLVDPSGMRWSWDSTLSAAAKGLSFALSTTAQGIVGAALVGIDIARNCLGSSGNLDVGTYDCGFAIARGVVSVGFTAGCVIVGAATLGSLAVPCAVGAAVATTLINNFVLDPADYGLKGVRYRSYSDVNPLGRIRK